MITLEQAKKLPTKRLLTYYKKYGRNWNSRYICDGCGDYLCEYEFNEQDRENHDKEEKYWKEIKNILDTREHIKN